MYQPHGRTLRRLLGDRRGGVAMIFALLLPILSVAAVAGVQLSYVVNARGHAQDAADQAALAGASQMSLGPGASERARQLARTQLARDAGNSTFTVSAAYPDKYSLQVAVDVYTPSFFGDMLPRGGFRSHVTARAEQESRSPLCVLSTASDQPLQVVDAALLTGTCLMHGNADVTAAQGTQIDAARVEASGSARGMISPAARTGAPRIDDPLSSLDLNFPGACGTPVDHVYNTCDVIPAGIDVDNIIVNNNNMPTFAPGIHYIGGRITIWVNATLSGDNVAMIMGKNSSWDMHTNSHIIVTGLRSGPLAGLVLGVTPDHSGDYSLPTNPFDTITGVIYAPTVNLKLYGNKVSGEMSDWTIVVSKGLSVTQQASLEIKTNYQSSPTPVPQGVGDHVSQVALTR